MCDLGADGGGLAISVLPQVLDETCEERAAAPTDGPFTAMRLLMCLTSALILCEGGEAAEEPTAAAGRALHVDGGTPPGRDHVRKEPSQHQQVLGPPPGLCRSHCRAGSFRIHLTPRDFTVVCLILRM